MNSSNNEPQRENLDMRIKRMLDEDQTSRQTTPERVAKNQMEVPQNNSLRRLPSQIKTYKPTNYERPKRIYLEVTKYEELMSAKQSLDRERQVMRFEKESLEKKVQDLYKKMNQKEIRCHDLVFRSGLHIKHKKQTS